MTDTTPDDFGKLCTYFTSACRFGADWKRSYSGATHSTRLRVAIADLKRTIAEAEKHPEIGDVK